MGPGAFNRSLHPRKTHPPHQTPTYAPHTGRVDPALAKALDKIAEDIVNNFEQQMSAVMENLERGEAAFDDLNALLDSGSEGFDLSRGTWRRSGWRELDTLRNVLEACPELRDLVRQLGRGGGKGPLRRAPEEVGGVGAVGMVGRGGCSLGPGGAPCGA